MKSEHEHTRAISESYFAMCKAVDTPVSLACWLKFKYSQKELSESSINPFDYTSPSVFFRDYSVVELLSKYKGLQTGVDTEKEALRRFTLAEEKCKSTNLFIKRSRMEVNPSVDGVIHSARRKIARLLGDFSLFALDGHEGFGPGATYEIPRRRAFLDTKLCELPFTVTRKALSTFKSVIERDLHWSAAILGSFPEGAFSLLPSTFEVVDGCRVVTVPKNAKTDRTIAVEPRGNSFLQKAVGRYIRRQLRRVGIDLEDQSKNQRLALEAVSQNLATIDLSMASDTVSLELVYELLPWDWVSYLDDIRSQYAIMDKGVPFKLEKFSSMGNGFTFELETLIFWALTQALTDEDFQEGVVSVYGDDIICSRQIVPKLISTLSWAGFAVNVEKSHYDGLFFESCGKHYFDGQDVTPCYQKEIPESLPEGIRLGNRLIRLAERWGGGKYLDKRLESAWRSIRRSFKHPSNPEIPYGVEGDDGWSIPYREFSFGRCSANHGIRCRVLQNRLRRFPAIESALLAWSLRNGVVTESPYEGSVSVIENSGSLLKTTTRWIIPSGKFSINWE